LDDFVFLFQVVDENSIILKNIYILFPLLISFVLSYFSTVKIVPIYVFNYLT
jgi:hypothetical protein